MNLIISYDVKFKTNENKIEKIFAHFGLRKIQNSTYIGNLNKNEQEILVKNINDIVKEYDSIIIAPICKNCYSKKEICGRKIKFNDDLFRVY